MSVKKESAPIYKGISLVDEDGKKKSRSTIMIEIGNKLTLFHDPDQAVYAEIPEKNHVEIWQVDSRSFKTWLSSQYYRLSGKGADRSSVNDAIETLKARGMFDGEERRVYLRVAEVDGRIYVDMVDPCWRVLEIDAAGWRILDKSPVMFIRKKGMTQLPEPLAQYTLYQGFTLLGTYLNINREDIRLVEAFIVSSFRGRGPYPILNLLGENGTAKTSFARTVRYFIDPSTVPVRQPPRDERDFLVGASNNWVVCLDNLSGMAAWLSDAMCRLSTGGGYSSRELYTNNDEVLIDVQRPSIVNGIDDLATRPDFAERSLTLKLEPIRPVDRKTEEELYTGLAADAPEIFASILNSISKAIRELNAVTFDQLPRMADFARWAYAASIDGDAFLEAFNANQKASTRVGLEASPVARAIMELIDIHDSWTGTADELLTRLNSMVDDDTRHSRVWPKSATWLKNNLNRLGASLRKEGYDIRELDSRKHMEIVKTISYTSAKLRELRESREPDTQFTQYTQKNGNVENDQADTEEVF